MDTYKKKYKGALARCKWLLSNGMISKIAATDMFRELMDNDENIRKEIINIFHSLADGKIPVDINYADIFTWLEKQGSEPNWCHHKVDLSNCSEEYRKAYYDGWNNCNQQHSQCKSEWNDVVKCLINGMKFYYEDNEEATWGTEKFSMKVKDILSWLEKQGDSPIKWNKNTEGNKPQVNHSVLMKTFQGISEGEWKGEYWEQYRWAGIVRDSDVLSWMELSDLEKQGKQKPTLRERYKNIAESEWFKKTHEGMSISDDEKVDNVNKIELKFKVGDWITNGVCTIQITSIDDRYYWHDNDCVGGDIESIDKEYHLWTIQDAKNGNVLSDGTTIFIFKDLLSDGSVMSYCDYDTDSGESDAFCPLSVNLICSKITPATKEQRDLLFQKMKEAGYEWDADKKELKKADVELTDFEKSLKHIMIETLECGDTHNLKADAEMLLRFAQKPAWSEKDEKEYKYVLKFVDNILNNCGNKKDYEHCKRCYDWLKSLKQKIGE